LQQVARFVAWTLPPARILRVSTNEPHPVSWPGAAVAVQKAALPMQIAARKIKPPAAFAGAPAARKTQV
jgi:hypothetical protein